MVDSRRARDENSSLFYCVQWQKVSQMWMVRVHYGGERRYLGLFHDEKDASLVADEALRRIGAGARCNWLDGTPTGYGRRAEAHQISGLLGAAKRKSVWFGVKEYRDPRRPGTSGGFFVRLRLADCRWKSKKKPYPLPCAVTVTLREKNPVKCKCKTEQHNFTNPSGGYFKIEEEAAKRYNEAVCEYGYHEPPYSMPLNPPAGVEWKLTSGS